MQERIKVNLTLQEFLATVLPGTVQPYVTEVTLPDGSVYETTGVSWALKSINGAALVSDAALDYKPYSDATYDYYCEAAPGTALSTAAWRIVRKNRSTGYWQYADGGAFSNAATNLTTVQGAFA